MATYATGRVTPGNIKEKHEASWKKYGFYLEKLPDVTARQWDCRNLGIVNPIKNQGNCGSCWDFSGTSVIESVMIKAGLGKSGEFVLSEQYTLDCGRNGGCSGDDNSNVCEWAKNTGLPLTSDYGPYQGYSSHCKSGMKMYKISDWGYCGPSDDVASTQSIKNCMAAYGPIGSAIAANSSFMNNPPGSVFHGNNNGINHDIVLVGWDDDKGAWLLRNSWGTDWCDGGYCWIAYGANCVGMSALWATLPSSVINWYV